MTLKLTQLPEAVQEEVARVRQVVSDLHAELKQILGPRCLSYTRREAPAAEPEMEQVS